MTTTDHATYLTEMLDFANSQHHKAEAELAAAARSRRISAALAVRGGIAKSDVARHLGISRPTLDAWIGTVEGTADELVDVEQTEYVIRRTDERKAQSTP